MKKSKGKRERKTTAEKKWLPNPRDYKKMRK
jgi:hypothetical protein